ncbi:MAG: tRNA lysidine(34) synthetase TilS [Chitinophagaceae bacterium]|nr:MAG: tRNA lysidine(34) synthetase TilS [Chitinophagaceae bacterium]
MDLLHKFQEQWQEEFCQLTPGNTRLLVAVSGGVDSVVLVDLLQRAGFDFVMAHVNFQLRGSESERDEQFVRSLADKYGNELLVKKFDTKLYAEEHKLSIQEAARVLRYDWFSEILAGWQLAGNHRQTVQYFIVTAHHADDNIETVLMHFFRGTGIQGMAGIQPLLKERQLIRPLLGFRKNELQLYAAARDLSFVEDSSNASDKYTRNYFRNQLLPQIKEVYPQVEENLLHNIERFREIEEIYRQSVDQQVNRLLEVKGTEWHVPVMKWKQVKTLSTITWELISRFGFHAAQTAEVIKLLDGENGGYQLSLSYRIIRNRQWMIISPNHTATAQHIQIEEGQAEVVFENGKLLITTNSETFTHSLTHSFTHSPSEASLDASEIRFPLLLRKWKAGDYFYPLGMQKKKKLGKFLIDLKLSRTEKEQVWVLESDKRILWVLGYRIDNRFRITEKTKQVLQVNYRK